MDRLLYWLVPENWSVESKYRLADGLYLAMLVMTLLVGVMLWVLYAVWQLVWRLLHAVCDVTL